MKIATYIWNYGTNNVIEISHAKFRHVTAFDNVTKNCHYSFLGGIKYIHMCIYLL